ncbi:MAG: non-ribosomal peptide synthase [Leptolyngbya sp. SIO3F4]|nr:non-ribosomal peptide synthase [Leptolyngbya sp. SIO3F4]
MNATDLLESLAQQGIQIWADENKLRINSPKGRLTPELCDRLTDQKTDLLHLLKQNTLKTVTEASTSSGEGISLATLGRLISGCSQQKKQPFKAPVIDPKAMAKTLKVTFRPLPNKRLLPSIRDFHDLLEQSLKQLGVEIVPWQQAIKPVQYPIKLPLLPCQHTITTFAVKAEINAVIDVERQPSWVSYLKIGIAETLYNLYKQFIWHGQAPSAASITQFISWAEDNIRPLEDPTNTQVIVLTELDETFNNPDLPYVQKIPLGVNTLIRTFAEIVIGVSHDRLSVLNMNLSDAALPISQVDHFVLKSLIPKIYVPILPLPLSRFEVSHYNPEESPYVERVIQLGHDLAPMNLLPSGFKIDNVITRRSHRDIVNWMANGRTGVSYGFVAYAEPPKYVGPIQIDELEWETLTVVDGLPAHELRQNNLGRRYLRFPMGDTTVIQQIPDIWVVSSRSGANKTNLNQTTDVLRIGLQDRLLLQLPQAITPATRDIKPSYDLYVMLSLALAAALFAPQLIQNGMPIVHFHGYPSSTWFTDQEYCVGMHNPSVPCGTYESGVFNFLGIQQLVQQHGSEITMASLIEPDHGTNLIAKDANYLIERIRTGITHRQIELGGKYLSGLKA